MLCAGVAADAWMGMLGSCDGTPRMLPPVELEHEPSASGRQERNNRQGTEMGFDCREDVMWDQGVIWSAGVLSGRWSLLTVRTTRGTWFLS